MLIVKYWKIQNTIQMEILQKQDLSIKHNCPQMLPGFDGNYNSW